VGRIFCAAHAPEDDLEAKAAFAQRACEALSIHTMHEEGVSGGAGSIAMQRQNYSKRDDWLLALQDTSGEAMRLRWRASVSR
jgi:hypothetical protein